MNATTSRFQEHPQSPFQGFGVESLALPYDQDIPAECFKFFNHLRVALDVPRELIRPILSSGLGSRGTRTTRMSMPKAPMNEDRLIELREHHVRSSRQVGRVKPESVPEPVRSSPNTHLGSRAFAFHSTHQSRSGRIHAQRSNLLVYSHVRRASMKRTLEHSASE